ncbi:MAG: hypothetical protein GY820_24780 [Gammaproteobacteria bacterium]|nr:hypothetical protein [Gammaproteobacteria bacterium]
MKIFFSLLLIANIAFGLVQWLMPYDQLFEEKTEFEVAEKLVLLTESEISEVITEVEAIAKDESKLLVRESSSNQLLCYTVGPFKGKAQALEISGRYSMQQIKTRLKSSLEKDYQGVMVYISGHKTRAEAVQRAESLAVDGFREYIIINEPGKSNVLSVGVFGLKKNAERLIGRLKALNYPVESESRYRERTIYWLYYQQSNERELLSLLDAEDISNGISQFPRQCP